MRRVASLTFPAMLAWLMWQSGLAQDKPLRVEIVTTAPHQRDPIVVRVTNLTTKTIELAFPLYSYGRRSLYRQTVPSDPVNIERKKRLGWDEVPSALPSRLPRPSPRIAPGETNEYQFSVVGAGEYRVRLWYVVSLSDLERPPSSAELRSVVSAPIHVN